MMKILIKSVILGLFLCLLSVSSVFAQIDKPSECIKLGSDVKIKDKTDPTGQSYITYQKGLIIAPDVLSKNECMIAPLSGGELVLGDECEKGQGSGTDLVSGGAKGACWTDDFGIIMVLSVIYSITDWLFLILMTAVVLMIIWGGFQYVTAGGDPAKADKGKSIIKLSIIGLAIALLAKMVPSLVRFIVGV